MDDFEYKVEGARVDSQENEKEIFAPQNPLNRPPIRYRNVVISLAIFIVLLIFTPLISKAFMSDMSAEQQSKYSIICTCVVALIYLYAISKRAVIWCVKVYQHYAPDHVRLRCVFEPSCSEYMILAVKKYGTIIGVAKGIDRLLRCHYPGGIDYP